MYFDEVIVTRSILNTRYHNNNLSICGIIVSVESSYNVISLLTNDLKHCSNTRISIIVQNLKIIILVSNLQMRKSEKINTQNQIVINPLILKTPGVNTMTGYGIYSLLHEDFIKIHNNTILSFNKFNRKSLWRPYKISSLKVDSTTFSKMLEVLSSHRFVFSFNPCQGFSELQITLIIIATSNEQLKINTQEALNNLSNIKTLHGELEAYHKKELRKSMLQILLGANNVTIKSSLIIKYFQELNFLEQNHLSLPKFSVLHQDHFNYKNAKNLIFHLNPNKRQDSFLLKTTAVSTNTLFRQLESDGWILDDIISQQLMVYANPNRMIHVIVCKNIKSIANLNDLISPGISVVFWSNGEELKYVKTIVKT